MTAVLLAAVHWALYENHHQRQRLDVTQTLSHLRGRLEGALSQNFLFLEGVADFIAVTPDLTEERFLAYAALAFKNQHLLKNIGAAPDLVLRYVYPLEGNRAILGKAYRDLPEQWPDVQRVIATGELVTAGPLNLIQGGVGLIGRMPVQVTWSGIPRLWGIVSSVIDMDGLYAEVGMETSGLSVALRKPVPPAPAFYGSPALFHPDARAVILSIDIPGARWELAAVPQQGWTSLPAHILALDLLVLLLGAGAGVWSMKTIEKNRAIQKIRKSLDTSQALSHLGSWSLDLKTNHLWWSDETYRIFGLDRETTVPSLDLVREMIPEPDREQVQQALDSTIAQCGSYQMEHRIRRAGGTIAHVEARGLIHSSPDGRARRFTGTILDITPRKTAENELIAREKQMRAMALASHDALIMIDAGDRILFWSDTAEKMFGWTAREAVGQSMHRLITLPDDQKNAEAGLRHFSRTGTGPVIGSVLEFEALRKDGTTLPVERSVAAFELDGAHYAVGSLRDISDRKKKEELLRRLATTDALTGMNNRRRFMELLEQELTQKKRYGTPLSVIMFDADKFKSINDTHGHDVGDTVLRDIARVTGKVIREADFTGRLGGEEFAVALPHTELEGARNLAERLREAFASSALTTDSGKPLHYTVSLGVACCPQGGAPVTMETLMKQADTALYRAKDKGRNRVEAHQAQGMLTHGNPG